MISLSGISKTFNKGNANEVSILNNFNLEVNKGDFIILVGSNGSGKSTVLNVIAGTVSQDSGSVYLDNKEISNYKDYRRSKWIARIFQDPLAGTAPELTILENFRLASLRTKQKSFKIGTGGKFRNEVKEKVSLLNLGLENKVDQLMGDLSGGQRQSLALLMAIADDTKLLLLDEPTAALDPKTSELVMKLAEKVIKEFGLTALLVTHQMKDVIEYGNRIIQVKEGRIIRDFIKDEKTFLNISDIYKWFDE